MTNINTKQIKSIEMYGKKYKEKFLQKAMKEKDIYCKNWQEALLFFIHKSFYRGRKDSLSERFSIAAADTLKKYWSNRSKDYVNELPELLKNNGVNNQHDRKMVIEAINFVDQLKLFENNIVLYSLAKIKEGNICEIFESLNKIHAIKDKLSSFYLRDFIFIYNLEDYIQIEDFKYCQPVDTWVEKVAKNCNIIDEGTKDIKIIKDKIIHVCSENSISPLLFNAGAWFVGSNSFTLLLETLSN